MLSGKLQGKWALVTGSNRGIGKAVVEKFASEGANIYAHSRIKTEKFESEVKTLSEKYGVNIIPIYFDITDKESMKAVLNPLVKDRENSLDILVNNAGKAHGAFFSMTKIQDVREVFEVNLFAAMEITQIVLKKMMRQKSGAIVNISSLSGIFAQSGGSAYGVSKAALKFWTEILAIETAKFGIRVNGVAPGVTNTDMANLMEEKAREESLKSSAMGRAANPEEIAAAVLFLASDDASFINGHTIAADGGRV